jgi:S-DNA-T family DNA segregation ATPase FtsK/SpoIIIE
MLAKGAGSTARSVGRARDLEPGHRRDGIALALLGIAVVIAASSWFDAARPVGQWIDTFLRVLIGSGVLLVPIGLAAIAVVLMRTEADPEARPRLILGAAMITLPTLGLWHLWAGSPTDPPGRQHAAGFLGFAIGGPLSEGLTEWIAAPLLFIGALFGLLLVTGTTIREVPSTVQRMFSARAFRGDENYGDEQSYAAESEDFSDSYYDDPAAYKDDEAQAWPSGTPMDNYPIGDEAPTVPEPTARTRKKKPAKKQTQTHDRIVDGPYI